MVLGTTPYINRGGQDDPKRIWYQSENAQTFPVTVPAGYGVLPSGQVMGIISESTSRVNYAVPYVPGDTTGRITASLADVPGLAYLVGDGEVKKTFNVLIDDSYKFAVGDHLVSSDSDGTATDLGAITAIDRTTYSQMAQITVTNNLAVITVAKGACAYIQTTTSDPFVKAAGILFGSIDTGVGEDAKGGNGTMVVKAAVAYKNSLYNYNSDVLSDLSWGFELGNYLYL